MTPYLTESIECYLITNPLCKFYHLFIDVKTNFKDGEAGSYFKVYKSWPSVASPTDIQNKPLVNS